MSNYKIEKAIQQALDEAESKFKCGKLFKSGDESDAANDFTNGDPETIYSLSSLYAQYVEEIRYDTAVDLILEALIKKYPDYS